MDHKRNRREQQRRRMMLIVAAVVILLAIAILCITLGVFDKTVFTRSDKAKEEGGIQGWTARESNQDVIVYDGKKYEYNDHLSNYLLMGVDSTGSIREKREPGHAGQSDFIFFLSYDRAQETLVGLSIPRETLTQIERFTPGGDSLGFSTDFLTLQYAYGDGVQKSCKLMTEAVSRLIYGIPIQGYAAVNLQSVPKLAELVGGVEVTVPDDTLADKDPAFTKGNKVVLDASNTSLFIRSRDSSKALTTPLRRERQKVFLSAFADKLAKEQKKDASTVSTILETMKPEMVTNMSNDIFADMATSKRQGEVQTIPGTETHEGYYDIYRVDDAALYEMMIRLFYKEVP